MNFLAIRFLPLALGFIILTVRAHLSFKASHWQSTDTDL